MLTLPLHWPGGGGGEWTVYLVADHPTSLYGVISLLAQEVLD